MQKTVPTFMGWEGFVLQFYKKYGIMQKVSFIVRTNGQYIQLEEKAADYILDNIRRSVGNKIAIVNNLSTFTDDTGLELTLENFLTYYHIDFSAIYNTKNSFARLCQIAGVKNDFAEQLEEVMTKSFSRICSIDSRRWIEFIVDYLPEIDKYTFDDFSEGEIRMWQMLQFTIWQKTYEECGFSDLFEGFRELKNSPVMLSEMLDILY